MKYNAPWDTWQAPLNKGSGHWSISPGLSFVRITDPAILFGGTSDQHAFRRTIDGYAVKPGSGIGGTHRGCSTQFDAVSSRSTTRPAATMPKLAVTITAEP